MLNLSKNWAALISDANKTLFWTFTAHVRQPFIISPTDLNENGRFFEGLQNEANQ